MNCTGFWIVGAVYQATDPGMNKSPRAHRAWLNCSKELAAAKTMVTKVSARIAQGDDFGVCGRIVVGQIAIPATPDDASFMNDDCSDWNLASVKSPLGGT